MPNIREMVEAQLERTESLSKTLYRQLLEFDEVESAATGLGYNLHLEMRVPLVTIYRETPHSTFPWYVKDEFNVIPRRPDWLEESGWIETYEGGFLKEFPKRVEEDVIDIIAEGKTEIKLGVYYSHSEANNVIYRWDGEVHSIQALIDLLKSPPST